MFRAELKAFNDALNILPQYEVEDVSSASDLATYLSTTSAALVIASLKDKNDLIQIATFLKISKKIAKETVVKLVVVNFSGDKQYEKAMIKLGVQDLIEPGINTKALKFKIDFWMKSLNVQIRNNASAAAQKSVKAAEDVKVNEKKSENPGLSWLEPLEIEDDIWITKNDNDCKKVLSKWLIRLMGPSPYVAQWVEVKASHWRFDFKENEKEFFISGNGSWFFQGDQRPEFVWKENTWLITGANFDLYFKDGNQIVSRLKSKDRNLTICKNSVFANTKKSIIIESFDKDLIFKRENDQLGDIEGKGKTDNLDYSSLSGKNKSSENIDGNLSGKTEGEKAIKKENLVQKTETEKKSTHWDGKNSNSAVEDDGFSGPKADGPRGGANLERERKDIDHQKYYKNHNETQEYQAPEAKERKAKSSEDKASANGNLSGKSSTDGIEKNYDNSKTEREKKEVEAKGKELSGDSFTDKLDSHYGKPKDPQAPGARKEEEKDKYKDKETKTKEHATHQKVEREKTEAVEREKKEKEDREINERTKAALEKMRSKELERKDKEEQVKKERSKNSQENTAESEEKYKKFKEEIATGKERNEKANNLEKDQKATRKAEVAEQENKNKSKLDKNWEPENDLGMKGESSTDKLAAHYKTKKQAQEAKDKEEEEATDPYAELFGKGKTRPLAASKEKQDYRPVFEHAKDNDNDNVLPLSKVKEDKNPKTAEDKELDELTREAKVIASLTQNNKKFSCQLDDFFDEKIIFRTQDAGIQPSGKVSLDIVFKFMDRDSKLLMQGDVLTVEGDGDGASFVTIKVSKDNSNSFDTFMQLFQKRQSNASDFLKKVKGI